MSSAKKLITEEKAMSKSRARVKVLSESSTGRNQRFHDNNKGSDMTRTQFVNKIGKGEFPNYHVRNVNGVPTPASNPNGRKCDNLG